MPENSASSWSQSPWCHYCLGELQQSLLGKHFFWSPYRTTGDVNTPPANGILSYWVWSHVRKHTTKTMTKCNFIILSPFKYWHACLTLPLGQQQVPAQLLWPNQSCNKVSASAFPSSLFLLHCQRHRHIFSDMFCLFYFNFFIFMQK